MSPRKFNLVGLILIFGFILTLLLSVERIRLGARPGLGLITAGLLFPLVFLSYYQDYQFILDRFKNFLFTKSEGLVIKYFFLVFCYLGILFIVGYALYTNFMFYIFWFLVAAPGLSFGLVKMLKKYL
ncbi:hypothetical protein [Natranaerobius thermophilus]|uniref:Uncharacterized protein n=1 Tax=Natranaerobius thermophilus (strain ATCC BAA-1301 / DSM 18059 / JW/NM-WN-LF) TaxID=457570 RepID=B2A8I4_NATTJ|nr:hypothetical protein [Natranaerobius thermophilus]ACB85868.1 hypothetical protein Nther_2302 [Natranaerobius thermophilus JW/NM-WN-LF]